MTELTPDAFVDFFAAVHGQPPFQWQVRLARQVVTTGRWPSHLDLPTGSGKTAALDVAIFHLACEAGKGPARRAPVRILFVVDRRIVVDAAFDRAQKIAAKLREARDGVLRLVAERLQRLAGPDAPPLDVVRLRGGIPQERDWVRSPAQPLIAVSTVDQVGSRLLFRGYGVSPRMWPVHAGLVGADALWLLDEVHLSTPLEETLDTIAAFHEASDGAHLAMHPRLAPFAVVKLSATPGRVNGDRFTLADGERRELNARLSAQKLAVLEPLAGDPAEAFASHALHFAGLLPAPPSRERQGRKGVTLEVPPVRRVGVVVNRVDLARQVRQRIADAAGDQAEVLLLTGRVRPLDRDLILRRLEPLLARPGRPEPDRPIILVATQTIEVGADLDLEALVTEIAPLDCLRQRFGRLDRLGLRGSSHAVILYPAGSPARGGSTADNPWGPITLIYGDSAYRTLQWLLSLGREIDFGIDAMDRAIAQLESDQLQRLLAPRLHAPVLLPPYGGLWAMTSPAPVATPEPALFLHGSGKPADVLVVWRAGVDPGDRASLLALEHCPPSALEAIPLPVWLVRRWLRDEGAIDNLADVPQESAELDARSHRPDPLVLIWNGEEWQPRPVGDVRPGDMVVVPAERGGCDTFGWNPHSREEVADLGPEANYRQRLRGALCVTRATLGNALVRAHGADGRAMVEEIWGRLTRLLESMGDEVDGEVVRAALAAEQELPETWRRLLAGMEGRGPTVEYLDDEDPARGFILFSAKRLEPGLLDGTMAEVEDGAEAVTARPDSAAMGRAVLLSDHLRHVEERARTFAERAGLNSRLVELIGLAARLHDVGKADPRFQADLYGASALAAREPDLVAQLLPGPLLAKGARTRGHAGRVRAVPDGFRHEALSVALAQCHPDVAALPDDERDLVLWLIGTHHGYGRPFFPPCVDVAPGTRCSVEIDGYSLTAVAGDAPLRLDQGWFELAERVHRRYGPWELARLEAILRLADHAASAAELSRSDINITGPEVLA